MSSPRSDRSFWLATLAVAMAPCVCMVAVLYAWPPPALAAAPPEEPLRAPPPQLVLPVATHAWNAGANYDLIGAENRFLDAAVPRLLPRDEAANRARDPDWQPSPGQPDAEGRKTVFELEFAYRPDEDSVLAVVELLDCKYGAAVLRVVEVFGAELARNVDIVGMWSCERRGDLIQLRLAADCVVDSQEFRVGELLPLFGWSTRLVPAVRFSISLRDLDVIRSLRRAAMSKPPWPTYH